MFAPKVQQKKKGSELGKLVSSERMGQVTEEPKTEPVKESDQ
jgi:hypothetical protein